MMPELTGRPLLDTVADTRLYERRREHLLIKKSAMRRLNVLVTGDRGSGKTTELRQVQLSLRNDNLPVAFVDGKLADDASTFLELIRLELGEAPNLSRTLRERYGRTLLPRPDRGEGRRVLDLIDAMKTDDEEAERVILLVDGLPSPELGHTLFGRLRDELWQLPFNWVIAADEREYAALMEPPADAFFDRQVELSPLTRDEQWSLLTKRNPLENWSRLEDLFAVSEGNPRLLLTLARDAVDADYGIENVLAARAERELAASQLGRPASMLLAELEGMGSASASDEELLKRLGWTRPRATQVFGELERAGLVTSREEKGPSGRPRKVYQPSRALPR
jgi:hypothetical protein